MSQPPAGHRPTRTPPRLPRPPAPPAPPRRTAATITDDDLDALYDQLAKVRALRDDLRETTGARWIADALDNILDPTTTEATELETTARVFAGLHRSAEQDVTRVIDLYERWVADGAPPLGVPITRWWDRRLVELHHAIVPPTYQAVTEEQQP